jgi:hypothetical protein
MNIYLFGVANVQKMYSYSDRAYLGCQLPGAAATLEPAGI